MTFASPLPAVMGAMFRERHHLKISRIVVGLAFVPMVNALAQFRISALDQGSTSYIFSDQTMLSDPAPVILKMVARRKLVDVTAV